MNTTYEIRSARGHPVMVFDDMERARAERNARSKRINARSKRINAPLRLFEVTREEREI